ncbi:hypothetical protein [Haladaptatus halobius]|nr:hypothetical protein [Haladaptatus halobius]
MFVTDGGYQKREAPAEEYTYETVSVASEHPVRVLWEILDRLETILQRR